MEILKIKSTHELKAAVLPKNWAAVARARKDNPDAPLYKLLDGHGETLAESAYSLIHGVGHCKVCQTRTPFRSWSKGFAVYCSRTCVSKDSALQSEIKRKREQTMIATYGHANSMSSPILRQKIADTNIAKYGVEHAGAAPAVRQKIKQTNISRYGGASPNTSTTVLQRQRDTQRSAADKRKVSEAGKLGFALVSGAVMGEVAAVWRCSAGHEFEHRWSTAQTAPICRVCTPYLGGTSASEKEMAEFIGSLVPMKQNHREYYENSRYHEVDVLVPSKNIGFEFNGLYWHSELAGKGKDYHLNKMKFFHERGIRLIQFFEHEWRDKREICKSVIRAKLGCLTTAIGARTLDLREIDRKDAHAFFARTHLSGTANFKRAFGLFSGPQLLCASSWGADRFGKTKDVELIRFSSELNCSILGGLSRLTAHAHKVFYGCNLKSFCDRRFGDGAGYTNSGWHLTGESSPGYWYFDKNTVYHRLHFQKKKLVELTGRTGTEWELAQTMGLNRFWDCGNFIFTKEANV